MVKSGPYDNGENTSEAKGVLNGDDSDQALRLQRNLLAVAGGAVHTVLCALCVKMGFWQGTISDFWMFLAIVWSGNLLITLFFRTGLNKKFPDPSITLGQIMWATLVVMAGVYYIYELRMVFLMFYLLVMIFGSFRLKVNGFALVASMAVFSYGAVIMLHYGRNPSVFDARVEFIQWLGFGIVLACFAYAGAGLSDLRSRAAKRNHELTAALDKIRELAITDELTGVWNRRHIIDILNYQKELADRGGYSFVICFMDLDHFKRVNDRFGHNIGDIVLKKFTDITRAMIRAVDYLGRFGGEEFLLILVQASLPEALPVVDRIRTRLERFSFGDVDPELKITVSIGVTQYCPNEKLEEALRRVDNALYKAKSKGRNRAEVDSGPQRIQAISSDACSNGK